MTENRAYIAVCTSLDYLPGVKALYRSLKRYDPKYGFIIITWPKFKEDVEKAVPDAVVLGQVPVATFTEAQKSVNDLFDCSHWTNTLLKLSIFGLNQYDKLVYLDSDMLIRGNLDHLFDKPDLTFVQAGKLCGHQLGNPYNTGLMVICPRLYNFARVTFRAKMMDMSIAPVSDNEVICETFTNWNALSEDYNCLFYDLTEYLEKTNKELDDIKVVHFAGQIKPWHKEYSYQPKSKSEELILNEYKSFLE